MATNVAVARGLLVLAAVLSLGVAAQRKVKIDFACGRCDDPARGTFVNVGGLCLDAHDPDRRKNGGKVQVWECNGDESEQWIYRSGAIVNRGGYCLDSDPAAKSASGGGKVQVWACGGRPGQKWQVREDRILNNNGLCLDVHAPDRLKNGGEVQVWTCVDNAPTQQWKQAVFVDQ